MIYGIEQSTNLYDRRTTVLEFDNAEEALAWAAKKREVRLPDGSLLTRRVFSVLEERPSEEYLRIAKWQGSLSLPPRTLEDVLASWVLLHGKEVRKDG